MSAKRSTKKHYGLKKHTRKTDTHKEAGQGKYLGPASAFSDIPEDLLDESSYTDGLAALPTLAMLHPTDVQLDDFKQLKETALLADASLPEDELYLAAVVRLDRSYPVLAYELGHVRAEFSARLSKAGGIVGTAKTAGVMDTLEEKRLAVGDFVLARIPKDHGRAIVLSILGRKSAISRWRGSNRGERQLLATNVDLVLIIQALSEDVPNFDRVLKSGLIAADSNCLFGVIFTKADRCKPAVVSAVYQKAKSIFGPALKCVVTAAKADDANKQAELVTFCKNHDIAFGIDAVLELIANSELAMLLGESGAGKSTLINTLLGADMLETSAVRERDDKGRHTTVARRMVALPKAGVIIDEPGLRSLQLIGHEAGLAKLFPEIASAAADCKFRDCTHSHEPGCKVLELAAQSEAERERVLAYTALAHEMRTSSKTLDPDVIL